MGIQSLARAFLTLLVFALAAFSAAPAPAASTVAEVQTTWRLLDYIAVDYREAVREGRVTNPAEYREMEEFSASVAKRIAALPDNPSKAPLTAKAAELRSAIAGRGPEARVAGVARSLGESLLAAYPVPLAPSQVPDVGRGAALYAQNCASCHGAKGEGASGEFARLNPPPIAFQDRDRARERSVFALYQVITQGLEGTAMQSFAQLPEEDRWALAFHAGTLAYSDVARGETIWRGDSRIHALVPDLAVLAELTPAELERRIGPDKAAAVIAYLRASPGVVAPDRQPTLELARSRLRSSLAAYESGDRRRAEELALSAYLDGFEPVEAVLATRDATTMARVEQAMAGFRSAITQKESPDELRGRLSAIESLLDDAEAALAPEAESDAATFLGAFAILLREGLEALLVVIAMIAFLGKAERRDALPYVHGGWVAALLAGAGTWAAATYAIEISGAEREITEGFGSLLAAVILLSVGIWMHGKSQAHEWRRYIAAKMQGALSRGSAWFLFGLAFIVVYREVFETILFYAALWTADNGGVILAGALAAVVVLGAIAWIMLRFSRKLPITQFFAYSAVLIAILAVILAGKGVGALQEAGLIPVTPLPNIPRITVIGLFPTAQAVAAQLLMIVALAIGFRVGRRPSPSAMPAE
jgi:high-affinity iron transporter